MLDDLLGSIIGEVIGDSLDMTIRAWRTRRSQRRGRLRCALRIDTGIQPGLTTSWRSGNAELTAGKVVFRGVEIVILEVSLPPADEVPRDRTERYSGNPLFVITTSTASLRWSVPLDQVDWALGRIGHPDPVAV